MDKAGHAGTARRPHEVASSFAADPIVLTPCIGKSRLGRRRDASRQVDYDLVVSDSPPQRSGLEKAHRHRRHAEGLEHAFTCRGAGNARDLVSAANKLPRGAATEHASRACDKDPHATTLGSYRQEMTANVRTFRPNVSARWAMRLVAARLGPRLCQVRDCLRRHG